MSYVAVALTQGKAAEWERLFGTARLPVLDRHPRLAELAGGTALVYDVAVRALHPGQVFRLAGHVARRNRMEYGEARALVQAEGFVIRAEGVAIESADAGSRIGRWRLWGGNATSSRSRLSRPRLS